eukprot:gene8930-6266_t
MVIIVVIIEYSFITYALIHLLLKDKKEVRKTIESKIINLVRFGFQKSPISQLLCIKKEILLRDLLKSKPCSTIEICKNYFSLSFSTLHRGDQPYSVMLLTTAAKHILLRLRRGNITNQAWEPERKITVILLFPDPLQENSGNDEKLQPKIQNSPVVSDGNTLGSAAHGALWQAAKGIGALEYQTFSSNALTEYGDDSDINNAYFSLKGVDRNALVLTTEKLFQNHSNGVEEGTNEEDKMFLTVECALDIVEDFRSTEINTYIYSMLNYYLDLYFIPNPFWESSTSAIIFNFEENRMCLIEELIPVNFNDSIKIILLVFSLPLLMSSLRRLLRSVFPCVTSEGVHAVGSESPSKELFLLARGGEKRPDIRVVRRLVRCGANVTYQCLEEETSLPTLITVVGTPLFMPPEVLLQNHRRSFSRPLYPTEELSDRQGNHRVTPDEEASAFTRNGFTALCGVRLKVWNNDPTACLYAETSHRITNPTGARDDELLRTFPVRSSLVIAPLTCWFGAMQNHGVADEERDERRKGEAESPSRFKMPSTFFKDKKINRKWITSYQSNNYSIIRWSAVEIMESQCCLTHGLKKILRSTEELQCICCSMWVKAPILPLLQLQGCLHSSQIYIYIYTNQHLMEWLNFIEYKTSHRIIETAGLQHPVMQVSKSVNDSEGATLRQPVPRKSSWDAVLRFKLHQLLNQLIGW